MFARNVAPGVWRLPFDSSTLPPFDHTNGWLIVDGVQAVLIDPGFRDLAGLQMLAGALAASGARRLVAVWLTHTHTDHAEGLGRLRDAHPDVDVYVHGSEIARLVVADRVYAIEDGAVLAVGERQALALHTPGHSSGHMAYVLADVGWTFVGDLLAGSGPIWIGAPDGDVAAYLESLERIRSLRARVLAPGHGDPLMDPDAAIGWARDHRLQREKQILRALEGAARPLTVAGLLEEVYPALGLGLASLAERSLIAHLHKLVEDALVERVGDDPQGPYRPNV